MPTIPKGYKFERKEDTLGFGRRTVKGMARGDYLVPAQILQRLETRSWKYAVGRRQSEETVKFFKLRDRALVCCVYLMALRISEALRLRKSDFTSGTDPATKQPMIEVEKIKLSKSKVKHKPRKHQTRQGWLPLQGERAPFTRMILEYLELLREDEKLFPFRPSRARQIVNNLTGYPPHYFRAFGEDYLYDAWEKDAVAVSDYIKVDLRTFADYVRERGLKYGVV